MKPDPVAAHDGELVFEVRCPSGALHFKIIDGDRLEVKCNHWQCRDGNSVVLHRYSLPDCEFLETLTFQDPVARGRGARMSRKEVP